MSQSFPSISGSGVNQDIADLTTRSATLNSSSSGTSAPTDSVEDGKFWYKSDDDMMYYRRNGAWVLVCSVTGGDVDYQLSTTYFQAKNMRLENDSSDLTAAAGQIGQIQIHTGEETIQVVASATKVKRVMAVHTSDYLPSPQIQATLGSTPPTAATKGLAAGWLFDATAEFMLFRVRVPQGYAGSGDLKFRLHTYLDAAETDGDSEAWTLKVVAKNPNLGNSVLAAVETTATLAVTLATADGIAEGDVHTRDITLDYDDADNPIIAGTELFLKLSRTNVTNVAGVVLVGYELLTPAGKKFTE